jgi:hypothetical protein
MENEPWIISLLLGERVELSNPVVGLLGIAESEGEKDSDRVCLTFTFTCRGRHWSRGTWWRGWWSATEVVAEIKVVEPGLFLLPDVERVTEAEGLKDAANDPLLLKEGVAEGLTEAEDDPLPLEEGAAESVGFGLEEIELKTLPLSVADGVTEAVNDPLLLVEAISDSEGLALDDGEVVVLIELEALHSPSTESHAAPPSL